MGYIFEMTTQLWNFAFEVIFIPTENTGLIREYIDITQPRHMN